jgi:hypothetical protein
MKTIKRFVAVALLTPVIAHAEFWTGNDLFAHLKSTNVNERVHAIGYVMGVFDATSTVGHCGNHIDTLTSGQARDVATQYLEQNPAVRDLTADVLLRAAFSRAWPCPKKKKGPAA